VADAQQQRRDRYTAARLARTTDVVRWSRRVATMSTWSAPAAVAFRDTATWLAGRLAARAELRMVASVYGWQPPAAARTDGAS
jgi:hypothetical protein